MSRQHKIIFGGWEMIPHLSGALYVPEIKTLLIADLHLEQGAAMARRGLHLPPFDTIETLSALESVITECAPEKLLLLGDSFHDIAGHLLIDEEASTRIRKITASIDTTWISGNHDPDPKTGLGGSHVDEVKWEQAADSFPRSKAPLIPSDRLRSRHPSGTFSPLKKRGEETSIKQLSLRPSDRRGEGARRADEGSLSASDIRGSGTTITLRHEPRRKLKNELEISGHLHPGCNITQRGIHLRGKCFVSDEKRLILPAFGRYTGAMSLGSGAFSGLFQSDDTKVWMIGRDRIHNFPLSRVS